ncbi:MAG: hypothetical protein HY917_04415 [Candidatus Diapherotrites archaeon]|nr:hypothetical protein [Candidatus Diapherotrites archaeon]
MGTITINVSDEAETRFRKAAKLAFGARKGSLGSAATEAMEEWAQRKMSGSESELLRLLEKGFNLGGIKYSSRDELHER